MTTDVRNVFWQPFEDGGLEHLLLSLSEKGFYADGMILLAMKESSFRLRYHIEANLAWIVQSASIHIWTPAEREILLESDGNGNWTIDGKKSTELEGCIDIDISVTPFTNTLAIRRLQLPDGQSAELKVVYIDAPELKISAVPQRYTKLRDDLYRYEGLSTNFVAELPLDDLGLVVDYPNLWKRVYPGQ